MVVQVILWVNKCVLYDVCIVLWKGSGKWSIEILNDSIFFFFLNFKVYNMMYEFEQLKPIILILNIFITVSVQ